MNQRDNLLGWVADVRRKFKLPDASLSRDENRRDYWKGYQDCLEDVERFANKCPDPYCLYSDPNHEGDHVVPLGHRVLHQNS